MDYFRLLGSILNPRLVVLVLALCALVVLTGYLLARNGKMRQKKPGIVSAYTVPNHSAAQCGALLERRDKDDLLAYELQANGEGYHIRFTQHLPTQQPLATEYLLRFTAADPACFTLSFLREAFGMREPVLPPALVDEFLLAKLGARRDDAPPLS